jgi:predicted nucleic acid-binding protein
MTLRRAGRLCLLKSSYEVLHDTNQVVYYLRAEQRVVDELLSRKPEGLALSIISVAELYEGVFRATDPQAAEEVLKEFPGEINPVALVKSSGY